MHYKRRTKRSRRLKGYWFNDTEMVRRQTEKEMAGSYDRSFVPDMSGYYSSTTPLPVSDSVTRVRRLVKGDMVHTTPYSVSCTSKKGSSLIGVLISVTDPWGGGYSRKVWRQGSNPVAQPWGSTSQTKALRDSLEISSQNALLNKMHGEMVNWDILTDAVELKETVHSLRGAAKFILRLGAAVRDRDIHSLAKALNLSTRPQAMRNFHRNIYGVEIYEALDRRTPFLVGQGLQNLWMNYRYSIMPMIYSLQDAMIALASPSVAREYLFTSQVTLTDTFAASSVAEAVPFYGPQYNTLCDITTLNRATGSVRKIAYYRFTDSLLDRLNPNTITSLAKASWELVPFSWVADWGLGFSDYLQRLDIPSCVPEVWVNVTRKGRSSVTETLSNVRLELDSGWHGQHNIVYAPGQGVHTSECFTFERAYGNVVVPSYSPTEVFLNWKRKIDSACLLWQKVASQSKVRCRILPR